MFSQGPHCFSFVKTNFKSARRHSVRFFGEKREDEKDEEDEKGENYERVKGVKMPRKTRKVKV